MGRNYETDAERVTVDAWRCKTCGKMWAIEVTGAHGAIPIDAEVMARRCCSENAPCPVQDFEEQCDE